MIAFASRLDQGGADRAARAEDLRAAAERRWPASTRATRPASTRPAEDYARDLDAAARGPAHRPAEGVLRRRACAPDVRARRRRRRSPSCGSSARRRSRSRLPQHGARGARLLRASRRPRRRRNLSRFDGVRYGHRAPEYARPRRHVLQDAAREGFGAEVKRRILIGTYVLSHGYYDAYYLQAQKVRRLIAQRLRRRLRAVRRDRRPDRAHASRSGSARRPTTRCRCTSPTSTPSPVNLAGLPALSIPCGFGAGGLPVGLQLIGNYFAEARMLARRAPRTSRRPTGTRGCRAAYA